MSQNLYKLPKGWEWKALNDIVEKTSNLSPVSEPEKEWTYIDISSIDRMTHKIIDPKIILGRTAPSRAKKQIQKNDILFATTRPNLKNVAILEGNIGNQVASTGFCILRTKEELNHKYLFYFSITKYLQNQIAPFISGASYPAITDTNLKKIQIPVPPLAEQERIVEKLDALFSRIDTATAHLNQTLQHAKALFASALNEEFSALIGKSQVKPFGDVIDNYDGKRIPIKASERKTTNGDYPYYGATGIIDYVDGFIFDGERLLISEDGANLVARKYPIAFIATGKYWVNNHAHIVDAKPELTTNHYLETYFAWVNLDPYITGAAQPKLSQKKLNTIPIPLPPLEEQKRIVAHLDGLSERVQTLEKTTCERIDHLSALKASLLDDAFRGKL